MKKRGGFFIVIAAAILLELISGIQYSYLHNLLAQELEKRAETELVMKAMITKSTINLSERMLKSHIYNMKRDINNPDSVSMLAKWIVKMHPTLEGCGIAFKPYFYPNKGRLYEPYAQRTDSGIVLRQLSSSAYNYTKEGFYTSTFGEKTARWTGPYQDPIEKKKVISYSLPLWDHELKPIGVACMDILADKLGDTLNHRNFYPSSYVLLMAEDGHLLAGPSDARLKADVEHVIRIVNDSTYEWTDSRNGSSNIATFHDVDGDKAYVFSIHMKGDPKWKLAVVYYDDEVYGILRHIRLTMFFLMMVAFGILGFIVYRFFKNIKRLQQTQLTNERIGNELRIAREIQARMLVKKWPPFPERVDIDIYGTLEPAREVGGDLYDFFIRDEKLFFCIGDVCGKSIPAALLMSVTQALFRSSSSHDNNPARIMHNINKILCIDNTTNMFITMFIGVLDLPTGRLRFCNAGHESPFVLDNDKVVLLEPHAHLPLAVFPETRYEEESCMLPAGSTLMLYTDGLTEAMNANREMFGIQRITALLEKTVRDRSQEPFNTMTLLNKISEEVRKFVGMAEPSDDLTMLAIRYTPVSDESTLDESITLKNDLHEVAKLSSFVKSITERLLTDKPEAKKLRLAVEEVVVNAMSYAYPPRTEGEIIVRCVAGNQRIKFYIIDRGTPFDPTETGKADTKLSAEERPIGGLGLLLVRELTDTINYERIDDKNILTLTLNIEQ